MARKTQKGKETGTFAKIIIGASWTSVLLLWTCSASVMVNPTHFRLLSILGLAFPFLLGGTLFMAFLSLIFTPRQLWITLLGLLVCIVPIRTYCPFNLSSPAPKGSLKVISYNTAGWGGATNDTINGITGNRIAHYLANENPDIVCVQEGFAREEHYQNYIYPIFREQRYHQEDTFNDSKLVLFSKYPIVRSKRICQIGNNGTMAYWLKLSDKDTLLVINNHLRSMGLTQDDRDEFHNSVRETGEKIHKKAVRTIISKISRASIGRAAMVDTITAFIAQQKGQSMIVCGDFNDSPISNTYYRMSKGLRDAYVRTGNGLGRSFNRDAIIVRIDYLFCSDDWRPFSAYIDNRVNFSDHYPIIGYFKRER